MNDMSQGRVQQEEILEPNQGHSNQRPGKEEKAAKKNEREQAMRKENKDRSPRTIDV